MKKQNLIFALLVGSASTCFAQTTYTKVSNAATTYVNTQENYKGVSWIDLDKDNRPDLFVNQKFLFHNDGGGVFSALPQLTSAHTGINASGSSWGDMDNDGDVDCITTSLVSGMHLNNGDNTFATASNQLPNFTNYTGWDCILADVDNNGRLDPLFLHACCTFHSAGPFNCNFYLQGVNGVFTQVKGYEFTDGTAPYTIPTWTDYDLDGDVDLFIGSGPAGGNPSPDFCYKNLLKETGTFRLERLNSFPFNLGQDGQVYNFIDYDNDGDLDICLTNYTLVPNRFYQNNGGIYTAVNTPFIVSSLHLSNCWGDLDNDGDLDAIFTSDGSGNIRAAFNQNGASFLPLRNLGAAGTQVAGIALADYDNDGDLDFYTNGSGEARAMFRNNLIAGNKWAQFTLRGIQSNRSAIGAKIWIHAKWGGTAVRQYREVLAHTAFQSQNDLRQHIGLNLAEQIDSVIVLWPAGSKEIFKNLPVNRFYNIVEGQGISGTSPAPEPATGFLLEISPNPAKDVFTVLLNGPEERSILQVEVLDSVGRIVATTFNAQNKGAQVQFGAQVPTGVYFVKIHLDKGESVVEQVVRQ